MEQQEKVYKHHYGNEDDIPSWKKEQDRKKRHIGGGTGNGVHRQYNHLGPNSNSVDPVGEAVSSFNASQTSSPIEDPNDTGKVFGESWKDQPQVVNVKRTTRTVEHYDENGKYTGSTKEVTEEEEFLREYYIT